MQQSRSRQHGLSIVELMISVAISLAVLSALSYVYVGSRGAYRTNDALARVQETGRFALEWLARDLRGAGFQGCISRGTPLTIYSRNPPGRVDFGAAIYGYENGVDSGGNTFVNPNGTTVPRVRGDVVVFSALRSDTIAYVLKHDQATGNFHVDNNCAGFMQDENLIVTDCTRAAVFTVTNTPQGACPGNTVLTHGAGENYVSRINPTYTPGSRSFIARFALSGYYIGNNRAGRPSLYRFDTTGATEEVVENVEDLDLLFGIDTDSDGSVDAYRKADAIALGDWERVLSVRVSLVAVSGEAAATTGGQVIYLRDTDADTLADAQAAAANDRRLRQVFTTTVALRNRLP